MTTPSISLPQLAHRLNDYAVQYSALVHPEGYTFETKPRKTWDGRDTDDIVETLSFSKDPDLRVCKDFHRLHGNQVTIAGALYRATNLPKRKFKIRDLFGEPWVPIPEIHRSVLAIYEQRVAYHAQVEEQERQKQREAAEKAKRDAETMAKIAPTLPAGSTLSKVDDLYARAKTAYKLVTPAGIELFLSNGQDGWTLDRIGDYGKRTALIDLPFLVEAVDVAFQKGAADGA